MFKWFGTIFSLGAPDRSFANLDSYFFSTTQ